MDINQYVCPPFGDTRIPKDIMDMARLNAGIPNPIVAVLLWSTCPTAAYWYRMGNPADNVKDPATHALNDMLTGKSLREMLISYGFEDVLPIIIDYRNQINKLRKDSDFKSTMDDELFMIDVPSVYGLKRQMDQLGGSWWSVLRYIRTWTVIYDSWLNMLNTQGYEIDRDNFQKITVRLTLPGDSSTYLDYPVWGWRLTDGRSSRVCLGLVTNNSTYNAVQFALVNNGQIVGDTYQLAERPTLYGLDVDTGIARPVPIHMRESNFMAMISNFDQFLDGNVLPMGALQGGVLCLSCGYRSKCFNIPAGGV